MKNFERWMQHVDGYVWRLVGVSVYDLSDCPFRDWFEDELPPIEAARKAVKRDGFYGSM
jgi:hypothetical protein